MKFNSHNMSKFDKAVLILCTVSVVVLIVWLVLLFLFE